MSKSIKLTLGLFLIIILSLTYLEASEPEPVNWNPSYLENDKIALGSYVFYESWKANSPAEIKNVSIPPFEFLNDEEEHSGTYFFINDYIVFDDSELNKVLEWVEKGNTAFISADYLSKNLLDTLEMAALTWSNIDNFVSRPELNFAHPKLKTETYYQFPYDIEALYFNDLDTLKQTVLGVTRFGEGEEEEKPNFVKAPFGKGEFLLHSNPQALANYFLLTGDNYKYAEGVLAYIDPAKPVFWDKHYKSGKTFYSSPLYILLDQKPLKWAYYFLLAGCVLFLIFEGKRKQRAIPVVEPLRNQTYDYAGTIADLYLEQKEYKALAQKKIEHFYEYIRSHYRIDTSKLDEGFYRELAAKTKTSETETKALFTTFQSIQNKKEITKEELQELAKSIRSFKQPA